MHTRLAAVLLATTFVACGGDEPAVVKKKGAGGGAGSAAGVGGMGLASGAAGMGVTAGMGGTPSSGAGGGASGASAGGGSAAAGASGTGLGGAAGKGGFCASVAKTVPPSFAKLADIPSVPNQGSRFFEVSGKYLVLEGPSGNAAMPNALVRFDPATKEAITLPTPAISQAKLVGGSLVYTVEGSKLKNLPIDAFQAASVVDDPRVGGKKVYDFATDGQGLCWQEDGFSGSPVRCVGAGAGAPVVVVPAGNLESFAVVGNHLLHLVNAEEGFEDHELYVEAYPRDGSATQPVRWSTLVGKGFTDFVVAGKWLAYRDGNTSLNWVSSDDQRVVKDAFMGSLWSDGVNVWGNALCSIARATPDDARFLSLPIVPLAAAVLGPTVYVLAFPDADEADTPRSAAIYQLSLADFEAFAK